ncbi:molybdenum cofactor guanylyltransferase MobA [Xanthobacter sp. TB0136]
MPPPLPFGLILAGGHGRRMQAGLERNGPAPHPRLKPLVMLETQPLIAHVVERVRPQVARLAINANDPPELFQPFGLPVIADSMPDRPGPLAGVLAGLEWIAREAPGTPLLTVPADTPFLPENLVSRLMLGYQRSGRVTCAASNGQNHHVIAIWPASAREPLHAALETGNRKVGAILQALQVVSECWDGEAGDPFFNINSAEDLAAARLHRLAK